MIVREDDLSGPEIAALLRTHLDFSAQHSPPEAAHALDLDALRAPEITFWTVWHDDGLLGCGALKALAPAHGEIKSMHTAEHARGRGVAARLLEHMIEEARRRAYRRLSLETGTGDVFHAARVLYHRYGFEPCGAFGGYEATPWNYFMTRAL